jgi:hypothetical protein
VVLKLVFLNTLHLGHSGSLWSGLHETSSTKLMVQAGEIDKGLPTTIEDRESCRSSPVSLIEVSLTLAGGNKMKRRRNDKPTKDDRKKLNKDNTNLVDDLLSFLGLGPGFVCGTVKLRQKAAKRREKEIARRKKLRAKVKDLEDKLRHKIVADRKKFRAEIANLKEEIAESIRAARRVA